MRETMLIVSLNDLRRRARAREELESFTGTQVPIPEEERSQATLFYKTRDGRLHMERMPEWLANFVITAIPMADGYPEIASAWLVRSR